MTIQTATDLQGEKVLLCSDDTWSLAWISDRRMDENTNLEETTVADLARCFSARSLAALAKPWGPHSSERAKLERALCERAKLNGKDLS